MRSDFFLDKLSILSSLAREGLRASETANLHWLEFLLANEKK
ncbi:MAG: hypothetical protein Lokiarch_38270 [Candidatus Lokiarchaeum sp. GC14_75]|nr:MAG: hypothetical protein Lokiarch_38270 [Candidatus Lokiarchaeum sp. GC14_75]